MLHQQLTVVIPCKNEINYLPLVLSILAEQENIKGTRVIVADANSTDGTQEYLLNAINSFEGIIKLEVIEGGKVAKARNNGLKLVTTPLVLFLDADAMLTNNAQLQISVDKFLKKDLDLMAAPIRGKEFFSRYNIIFQLFNVFNHLFSLVQPFAIGNFFLTRTDVINHLGAFDEKAIHAEDYLLSMKYKTSKFSFSPFPIIQDSRRFKKTGYLKFLGITILSFIMQWNKKFFYRDIGYWGKG